MSSRLNHSAQSFSQIFHLLFQNCHLHLQLKPLAPFRQDLPAQALFSQTLNSKAKLPVFEVGLANLRATKSDISIVVVSFGDVCLVHSRHHFANLLPTAARANPPEIQTFGNPDHPNGEFTHVNFFVDPIAHRDYTSEHLKSVRVRKVAFSHADFETDNALEVEVRTAAEEELRRRAYRECAMARLQGVSVGHHRYIEGDMTIAQYVDRKMCICWEDCWCQKLCTIYADVKCPCRRFIRLGTGPAGGASVEVEDLDDEMALAIWESNNVKF